MIRTLIIICCVLLCCINRVQSQNTFHEVNKGETKNYWVDTIGGTANLYEWKLNGNLIRKSEITLLTVFWNEPGEYALTVTEYTHAGCIGEERLCTVKVRNAGQPVVYMDKVNAFTPDGDGLNDTFKPLLFYETPVRYTLHIYNRWGALVYTTSDQNKGWDGTYNGQPAPVGVYAYKVIYVMQASPTDTAYTGSFLLMR